MFFPISENPPNIDKSCNFRQHTLFIFLIYECTTYISIFLIILILLYILIFLIFLYCC
nr:MAG TPA: hypothetical protein [Caudoviricetes sp.]